MFASTCNLAVVAHSSHTSLTPCACARHPRHPPNPQVSHYALSNCSAPGRAATLDAFRTLAWVAEGMVFIWVGMDCLDPRKWKVGVVGVQLLHYVNWYMYKLGSKPCEIGKLNQ